MYCGCPDTQFVTSLAAVGVNTGTTRLLRLKDGKKKTEKASVDCHSVAEQQGTASSTLCRTRIIYRKIAAEKPHQRCHETKKNTTTNVRFFSPHCGDLLRVIKLTYFIMRLTFIGETLELRCGTTPKMEIDRSPFRHTQSYKQSREKINTLQESEQGSTEESCAPYHRYHSRFLQRIWDTVLFCEPKLRVFFINIVSQLPREIKAQTKCLDLSNLAESVA